MTKNVMSLVFNNKGYLFGSRLATHLVFWLVYYISFSFIWADPQVGLFASFFLEFVLLPARLLAVYAMLYWLLPRLLLQKQFAQFLLSYGLLLILVGIVQQLADHYFYEKLLLGDEHQLFELSEWVRNVMLVNSTVLFVAAIKVLQLYFLQMESNDNGPNKIEIKADRRVHLVKCDNIQFLEGMGNYVAYYLADGEKLVSYGSLKSAVELLPEQFVRTHKSFVVNRNHIDSYNNEDIKVGSKTLPRGKDIQDSQLVINS